MTLIFETQTQNSREILSEIQTDQPTVLCPNTVLSSFDPFTFNDLLPLVCDVYLQRLLFP